MCVWKRNRMSPYAFFISLCYQIVYKFFSRANIFSIDALCILDTEGRNLYLHTSFVLKYMSRFCNVYYLLDLF